MGGVDRPHSGQPRGRSADTRSRLQIGQFAGNAREYEMTARSVRGVALRQAQHDANSAAGASSGVTLSLSKGDADQELIQSVFIGGKKERMRREKRMASTIRTGSRPAK